MVGNSEFQMRSERIGTGKTALLRSNLGWLAIDRMRHMSKTKVRHSDRHFPV